MLWFSQHAVESRNAGNEYMEVSNNGGYEYFDTVDQDFGTERIGQERRQELLGIRKFHHFSEALGQVEDGHARGANA